MAVAVVASVLAPGAVIGMCGSGSDVVAILSAPGDGDSGGKSMLVKFGSAPGAKEATQTRHERGWVID